MPLSKNTTKCYHFLLQPGNYMRKRVNNDGKNGFTFYCGKQVPMFWMNERTVKPLLHETREKNGVIKLNLSTIRQLHGNSIKKRIYKLNKLNKQQQRKAI